MFEFNLTTFIFQIANFLVLLVVLARFFYRPVLRVMNRREQEIQEQLDSAADKAEEADRRNAELDEREEAARQEAERLVAEARTRANAERQEILQRGRTEADELLKGARQRAESEQQSALEASRREIAHAAVSVAVNMVSNIAAKEVHDSLVVRLTDLLTNPDEQAGIERLDGTATVRTALELTPEQLESLTSALKTRAGGDVSVKVEVDSSLVAGCQVVAGGKLIDLSLRTLASQIESSAVDTEVES